MYKIEVEGDHCYRVGQQGLLVHNASQGNPAPQPQPPNCDFNYLFANVQPPTKSYNVPTGTPTEILEKLRNLVKNELGYGILVVGSKAYLLKSAGVADLPDSSGQPLPWGSSLAPNGIVQYQIGYNNITVGHFEASAASILRMLAATNQSTAGAVLYGIPKPCDNAGVGCLHNIEQMLPPGVTLKLWWTKPLKAGQQQATTGDLDRTGTGP